MSNVLVGWPNYIDSATLAGGSWETDLPLTHLQSRVLAVVARSTDAAAASTKVQIDLGAARALRTFALVNHNLSDDATVRVLLGTTAGADDVYATEWLDANIVTFGSGSDEWAGYDWRETIDDEYIGSPWMVPVVLPSYYEARHVTIEISDESNTDGYVQIGRVFCGHAFFPGRGAVYGMTDGYEPRSEVVEMESGGVVVWPRRTRRVMRLQMPALSHTADFSVAHEMQRRAGIHGEVLYLPSATDRVSMQRTGFLGRMKSVNPIAYPRFRMRELTLDLVELL